MLCERCAPFLRPKPEHVDPVREVLVLWCVVCAGAPMLVLGWRSKSGSTASRHPVQSEAPARRRWHKIQIFYRRAECLFSVLGFLELADCIVGFRMEPSYRQRHSSLLLLRHSLLFPFLTLPRVSLTIYLLYLLCLLAFCVSVYSHAKFGPFPKLPRASTL